MTGTATRTNSSLFHVLTKTQVEEPRSSNSIPNSLCALTQSLTRVTIHGNIQIRMMDKKTMNLTCYQTIHSEIRRHYGTNQNFIPRPSNSDVCPTDCKHKSLPKSWNNLIAPTKLKHIYKGRHFSQHCELRIDVAGFIRNQILIERLLPVPNN